MPELFGTVHGTIGRVWVSIVFYQFKCITCYTLTEVMMASSTGDSSHSHLTAGDNIDSSISSMASATYMGQEAPAI